MNRIKMDLGPEPIEWNEVQVPQQAELECEARAGLHGMLAAAATDITITDWMALGPDKGRQLGH